MNKGIIQNFDKLIQGHWFPSKMKLPNGSDVACICTNTKKRNKYFKEELLDFQIIYIPVMRFTILKFEEDQNKILTFNTDNFKDVLKLEKQLTNKNSGLSDKIKNRIRELESNERLSVTISNEVEKIDSSISGIIIVEDD